MGASVFFFLVAGLVLLVLSAELLVRGASRLALAAGVSPLIIGLTVVAFGTSAPEMSVAVVDSWQGQGQVALGNVIGSNIFNVLFVLGLAALIMPLTVDQQLVQLDVPLLVGVSFGVWLLASDGVLGRTDGLLLFAGALVYTAFLIRQSRRESKAILAEYASEFGADSTRSTPSRAIDLAQVGLGLGGLILGSRWLVASAVEIATWWGVSELVIGLTIVAIGTSLPELATSLIATVRGERDIAVGNVVGSNLFNLLAVLGLSALVAPGGLVVTQQTLSFDLLVMTAVAVACLPIFFTGHTIARWEGGLFLGYYVVYTLYLLLAAQGDARLEMLQAGLLFFAIPLTIVTLLVLSWRSRGHRQRMP